MKTLRQNQRVRISLNSGLDSDKEGAICGRDVVKTDGHGIPTNISGAYKPIDYKREYVIRLNGGQLIAMYKNRVRLA